MTGTIRAQTGVYLTQFPGLSLTGKDGRPVDWSDHRAAHQAVMRLFAPRLDGVPERRREQAGILYRVDVASNGDGTPEVTVLVQSTVTPEVVPPVARSIEVSERAWAVESGEQVVFRVAVNAVRRTSRYFMDEAKRQSAEVGVRTAFRRQTASVTPVTEIQDWLTTKLTPAFESIEIVSHLRDTTESGQGKGARHRVIVDTIDAVGTVADVGSLDELRRVGVGRSKAYGCGLLTVKKLG